MNWLAFAILSYALVGAELALGEVLALGTSGVRPLLVLPLVIFVALHASPTVALWSGLLLGCTIDLLARVPLADATAGGGTALVLGPHALGYAAAVYLTLLLRGFLIRKNPLSLVFMTLLGGGLSVVVVVALITIKNVISRTLVWSPGEQFVSRGGSVLYSAITAFVLAFLLRRLIGVLGLPDATGRRSSR
ncbi:MAG: hypothetical protein ACKVS8_13780 [Phycisphaerales bacterium]